MNRVLQFFCFSLMLNLLACSGTRSLPVDAVNPAIALFPEGEVTWSALYKGYKSNFHEVTLALAANELQYKGILTYLETNTKFQVDGPVFEAPATIEAIVDPDEGMSTMEFLEQMNALPPMGPGIDTQTKPTHPSFIKLDEIYQGERTGKFNCILTKDYLAMYFQAAQSLRTEVFTIELKKVKSITDNNPLVRQTTSKSWKSKDGQYDMVLTSDQFEPVLFFYDHEKKIVLSNDWPPVELDYEPERITTNLRDIELIQVASIVGEATKTGEMSVIYTYGRSPDKEILMVPVFEVKGQSQNEADFYSEAEFLVPFIAKQTTFNDRIDQQVNERMAQFQSLRDSLVKSRNGILEPSLRMRIQSNSSFECFYLDEEVGSFKITFKSTHHPTKDLSLNYSFKTDSFISLSDLFSQPAAGQSFVDNFIIQKAKELQYARKPNFVKYLAGKPFKHFRFNPFGIEVYTDSNGPFGSIAIPIPHEELRPYLKEDHPLQNLF